MAIAKTLQLPDDILDVLDGQPFAVGCGNFIQQAVDYDSTYRPEWQQRYIEKNYMLADPLIRFVMAGGSGMFPNYRFPHSGIREDAERYDVVPTAAFGHRLAGNDFFLGFIAKPSLSPACYEKLEKRCRQFHFETLVVKYDQLNQKDKTLIALKSMGHSNENAAYELGIGIDTLNKRIKRICRQLRISRLVFATTLATAVGDIERYILD